MFASTRLMLAIDEHGGGRQLARVKMWPRFSRAARAIVALSALLATAAPSQAYLVAVALATVFGLIAVRAVGVRGQHAPRVSYMYPSRRSVSSPPPSSLSCARPA